MSDDQTIEQNIRDVLANEKSAIALSNQLFAPTGLFNQIAQNEAERRVMVQSPLYKEAQNRLNELQRREAAEFSQTVEQAQGWIAGDKVLVKVERS
jgi:hypothetical protein